MLGRFRRIAWVVFLCAPALWTRESEAVRRPWPRRPGVILYHLKENASSGQRSAWARILEKSQIGTSAIFQATKSRQKLTFQTDVRDEEDIAEEMKASGAVDFAEPDYLLPVASAVPDDPQYTSQWFHQTINSPGAWAYTTGNAGVLVAVCDSGIDSTHPDLAANLSLPGFNVVDLSSDTTPIVAHGTAVAGVIGAVGNNSVGVTGINWGVRIVPVRITNNSDGSAWCSDMGNGIEWAADHGAKVINLSYETLGCPGVIEAAAEYAFSLGALTFVAAGNDSQDLSSYYPIPHTVILVGGSDSSDQLAPFSNYGNSISLAAPSMSIMTTQPGGSYGSWNGTSFAAPMTAGVAALIISLNPSWNPTTVQNLILATAKSVGPSNFFGYGRLDAGAALSAAQNCLGGNCVAPNPGGPPQQPTNTTVGVAADLSTVRAYPNPWRSDRHSGLPMTFDHLPQSSNVRIFTISGHEVRTLSTNTGSLGWDLNNSSGEHVASGIYIYLATNNLGQQTSGKLAVIR